MRLLCIGIKKKQEGGGGGGNLLPVGHMLRQAQNETDSNFSRGDMEGCAKLS